MRLILQDGDVEKNSAPTVQRQTGSKPYAPNCQFCEKLRKSNLLRYLCDKCAEVSHVRCQLIITDVPDIDRKALIIWTCHRCCLSELPFLN